MLTLRQEKRVLQRLVNTKKIKLKDVYSLITHKSTNVIVTKQSRFLHDEHYQDEITSLCHLYISIEE